MKDNETIINWSSDIIIFSLPLYGLFQTLFFILKAYNILNYSWLIIFAPSLGETIIIDAINIMLFVAFVRNIKEKMKKKTN